MTDAQSSDGACRPNPRDIARHAHLLPVAVDRPEPDVVVLRPHGEIDLQTAPVLRAAAADALASGPRALIVDLGDVTYLGSAGLALFITLHDRAQELDLVFGLVGGERIALRALQVSGLLTAVLPHAGSLDQLLHTAPASPD